MKFTVGELLNIKDNLSKLSLIKDVPAITGYRIAALLRHLSGPISDAEKARDSLIRKYAGPPEDGKAQVLPENMGPFINELNELALEEVNIDIKIVILPGDIKLPDATTLVGLDKFITVNLGE
jgi:hypothetical protein